MAREDQSRGLDGDRGSKHIHGGGMVNITEGEGKVRQQ